VETLRVFATHVTLQDIVDYRPAENITKMKLTWVEGPSIEEVLPVLTRWRHLRQLTLKCGPSVPRLEVFEVCDFIMEMKQLTYLRFIRNVSNSYCGSLERLRREVSRFALTYRPNFKFVA
jgi:hypothetical protein